VSKYIGETENNLRRVFSGAEGGGAIILFGEADALLGKRSEVKDSHDRYANIKVSHLLQRKGYRRLTTLTTNQKTTFDPAFIRGLRLVVQFPFPDVAQRTEIWGRAFPALTPLGNSPRLAKDLGAQRVGNLTPEALQKWIRDSQLKPVTLWAVLRLVRPRWIGRPSKLLRGLGL
jgi:hypothetical protein